MNRGNSGLIEEVLFDAYDGEMMVEVLFHGLAIDPFEVASGDDTGSEGLRVPVEKNALTGMMKKKAGILGIGILRNIGAPMDSGVEVKSI